MALGRGSGHERIDKKSEAMATASPHADPSSLASSASPSPTPSPRQVSNVFHTNHSSGATRAPKAYSSAAAAHGDVLWACLLGCLSPP